MSVSFVPHPYQRRAIAFALEHPYCGLFLDMGLGKTAIMLSVIEQLRNDYLTLDGCLIVAPKRVAEITWPEEAKKWKHTESLSVVVISGTPAERRRKLRGEADLHVISRDNIAWLVDEVGSRWKWKTVVLDELSSFKSHSSKRFRALRKIRPYCERVIGLTGTPSPNGYTDLWAEIALLDNGERLGKNITTFRRTYCNAYLMGSFVQYAMKDGAEREIDRKLSDIVLSMQAKDYLSLKEPLFVEIPVRLSEAEEKAYRRLEKKAVLEVPDGVITAQTAAAVTNKCLQMANGAVYGDDRDGGYHILHDRKLEALEELLEASQGESVLVFYSYRSDLERIRKRFPEAVVLEGANSVKDWNDGKIRLLVAHPASCGHGLNLQRGGRVCVWFGLPWSLELYLQANARLYRQGQTEAVRIYHLIAKNTLDEEVLKRLKGKELKQEELLKALKKKWEEA